MKTRFKFFANLVEDYSKAETLGSIKNNFKTCVEKQLFMFRGIRKDQKIGHLEPRETRGSQTSNNLILQFSTFFKSGVPSRKKSYFATTSYSDAEGFGRVYLVVPHDSVTEFAAIENDYNLKPIPSLSGLADNLSMFGYRVGIAAELFSNLDERKRGFDLTKDNLEERIHEFRDLSKRVLHEIDSTKEELNRFCEMFIPFAKLFIEVEENLSNNVHYFRGYDETVTFNFLTEFDKKYGCDILKALSEATSPENLGVKTGTFAEILDIVKDGDDYEIWFEGKLSYFEMAMILQNMRKERSSDNPVSLASEDFNKELSEFLARKFKV